MLSSTWNESFLPLDKNERRHTGDKFFTPHKKPAGDKNSSQVGCCKDHNTTRILLGGGAVPKKKFMNNVPLPFSQSAPQIYYLFPRPMKACPWRRYPVLPGSHQRLMVTAYMLPSCDLLTCKYTRSDYQPPLW